MRISYWSSDGCSSDLRRAPAPQGSRVIREALKMGDPRLLRIAQPVQDFAAPELQALITDLFDTMRHLDGAGLAAPQIGVDLRVVLFGFARNDRYPDAPAVPEGSEEGRVGKEWFRQCR